MPGLACSLNRRLAATNRPRRVPQMSLTRQEWFDRFTAALASVIGAVGEGSSVAEPSTQAPADGWVVTLRADEGAQGDLVVEFDGAATHDLAKRVNQLEGEADAEIAVNTLKELCSQAAGSMTLEAPLVGIKLAVAAVAKATERVGPSAVLVQIAVTDIPALPLRLWGDITLTLSETPRPARPAAPAPSAATPGLDVILDIDLPLMVRFGRTEMPLRTIASLSPGSVIDFGRSPDEPVEVLVSNQIVARGEVVIVGGNYGVRITDVTSAADRVRSVEGQLS